MNVRLKKIADRIRSELMEIELLAFSDFLEESIHTK
jgi:hypothetical protein